MKRYIVKVLEIYSTNVEVYAESEEEARDMAEDFIVNEEPVGVHCTTLDRNMWPIDEVDWIDSIGYNLKEQYLK